MAGLDGRAGHIQLPRRRGLEGAPTTRGDGKSCPLSSVVMQHSDGASRCSGWAGEAGLCCADECPKAPPAHTHTHRRTQAARDSERLPAQPAPITTIDKKGARAANRWVKLALVKAKRASGDFMLASLYEGTRPDGAAVLETERQRQTGRQADRQTERLRQTGSQADRETERQMQAGRHAERNTHPRAVRDRPDAAARGAAAALQATVLSSMCANLQITSR